MERPSLNYIIELSGGDAAFQDKLIAVVKEELPEEIKIYQGHMRDSAFAKAAEDVHKIKHKLGILSLEQAYELAIAYEEELKHGNSRLRAQFENILELCVDFISDL